MTASTFVDKGITYGRIDVSGIRHVGGHLTGASEFVAVEVKTDHKGLAQQLGKQRATRCTQTVAIWLRCGQKTASAPMN